MQILLSMLLATLSFTSPTSSLPQDAVIFFQASGCPTGYRRFSEMDGKFPLGGPYEELGFTGGAANETLTVAHLPAHFHYVVGQASDATPTANNDIGLHIVENFDSGPSYFNRTTSSVGENSPLPLENMPPFYKLVVCIKLETDHFVPEDLLNLTQINQAVALLNKSQEADLLFCHEMVAGLVNLTATKEADLLGLQARLEELNTSYQALQQQANKVEKQYENEKNCLSKEEMLGYSVAGGLIAGLLPAVILLMVICTKKT